MNQEAIGEILDKLIGNISLNELEKLARNVNSATSVAVCKAGASCKETSEYMVRFVEIDVKCAIDDGDEGSYTPTIKDIKICLRSMEEVIVNLGFEDEVSIEVNIGASKFYKHDKKTCCLNLREEKAYLLLWREFKRLASFEDMFHMNDQEYSSKLTKGVAEEFMITEFDCASYDGVYKAKRDRVGNCFHLKVGEIGSVTKCIDFVIIAKIAEWSIILSSHDSCETSDPFIADLCVGLSLDLIKIGVSCITSACNICNRVRELEIERAEEDWRRWPISCADHRVKSALAWFRNESPTEEGHCCEADVLEMKKKSYFKEWGLHGY